MIRFAKGDVGPAAEGVWFVMFGCARHAAALCGFGALWGAGWPRIVVE